LAKGLADIDGISIDPASVQTNIVIFDVSGTGMKSSEICARLKEKGVLAIGISETQIRMVTHLDVSRGNIAEAISILRAIA
jgi:threonine aldolase